MSGEPQSVESPTERDLIAALARLAIERVQPDELMVFDDVLDEYLADPEGTLGGRARDESLGFGVDLALLAPVALALAQFVVHFVIVVFTEAAKDRAKPVVAGLLTWLVRRGEPHGEAETPAPLSREQSLRVHEATLTQATRLGLDVPTATLLSDAIVGALTAGG